MLRALLLALAAVVMMAAPAGAVENAGTPYPRQVVITAGESDGVLP